MSPTWLTDVKDTITQTITNGHFFFFLVGCESAGGTVLKPRHREQPVSQKQGWEASLWLSSEPESCLTMAQHQCEEPSVGSTRCSVPVESCSAGTLKKKRSSTTCWRELRWTQALDQQPRIRMIYLQENMFSVVPGLVVPKEGGGPRCGGVEWVE